VSLQAEVSPLPKNSIVDKINELIKMSDGNHVILTQSNGQNIRCPVIQVPLNLPIYRIDSSRTKDAQDLMINEHLVPEDTFDLKNEYLKESQQSQHLILCQMAESNPNLFDLFTKEDPSESKYFHITLDGVLINGNCRTATLREMNAQGKGRESFNSVWAAVIQKPIDREELTKIELNMQLEDPWELKYDWIQLTTQINISRNQFTEDEVETYWSKYSLENMVSHNYHDLIRMRSELDMYLEHSGRVGQIEKFRDVTGYDQLLKTMTQGFARNKKKWTEHKKDEIRLFLYLQMNRVFDGVKSPEGRAYQRLSDMMKQVSQYDGSTIIEDLEQVTGIQAVNEVQTKTMLDLGLPTKKNKQINLEKVAKISGEDSVKVIRQVSQKNTDWKNERKNKKDKEGVKNSMRLALNNVNDAYYFLSGDFKEYNTSGLKEQIDDIKRALEKIEENLE
jgi:hypothetical protein